MKVFITLLAATIGFVGSVGAANGAGGGGKKTHKSSWSAHSHTHHNWTRGGSKPHHGVTHSPISHHGKSRSVHGGGHCSAMRTNNAGYR